MAARGPIYARYAAGTEVETHKTLKWQSALGCRDGEYNATRQRKIQNTTYIYPAAGGRGVKAPLNKG